MILDPAGRLVWFNPLRAPLVATNLRVQQLDGAPVLTWWQGTITVHGFGLGVDVVVGGNYRTITEVKAGNGYQADLHEFQITPQGTALVTSYNAIYCDLTAIGGGPDSAVTDSLMQEIDIKTGLVMFEWTSLDHVALSDSYSVPTTGSPRWPFDFFHLNSINLDPDGTLLVSSRNTWAADDIDPRTGQVLWTLGGKQSSFTEGRGAATAFQHDARPIGPDSFTMFDNGASPQAHAQSRGVVLDVDPQTHSVSVHTQYLHPGHPLLADSQGNMQALANGDWFVGWGQQPDLSEFSASGRLLFDASLPFGYESYRALRFRWIGTPASRRRSSSTPQREAAPSPTRAGTAPRRSRAGSCWRGARRAHSHESRSCGARTSRPRSRSARAGRALRQGAGARRRGHVLGSSGIVALSAAAPEAAPRRAQNSSRGECCSAARDEGGGRAAQRELAASAVGAGDHHAAPALAQLDDRHRLGLTAEVPDPRRRADHRQRARRFHGAASVRSRRGAARTRRGRAVVHIRVRSQKLARALVGVAELRGLAGAVEEEQARAAGARRPDDLRDLRADQARSVVGGVAAAVSIGPADQQIACAAARHQLRQTRVAERGIARAVAALGRGGETEQDQRRRLVGGLREQRVGLRRPVALRGSRSTLGRRQRSRD